MSYHSSIAGPRGGFDYRESQALADADNPDLYRFSGDNWSAPHKRYSAEADRLPPDFEIVDSQSEYDFAEGDLRYAKSTAARLTALEKIAASGEERFSFKDKDGVEREFRVETEKCGGKTLIHCYGRDANGREQIVMRVARNASGELEPQRDKDGKPVSYYGDNWSRSMQGRSFLTAETSEGRKEHSRNDERAIREPKLRDSSKPPRANEDRDDRRGDNDKGRESNEDRKRERERGRDRGREIGRDSERELSENRYDRQRPRLDIGRTLADVAMIAAPFLMAELSNKNRCHDYYPYRDYPRHLPERGCRNYYDDYGYRGFEQHYGRGGNFGWQQHNRGGHHYNYLRNQNKRCR